MTLLNKTGLALRPTALLLSLLLLGCQTVYEKGPIGLVDINSSGMSVLQRRHPEAATVRGYAAKFFSNVPRTELCVGTFLGWNHSAYPRQGDWDGVDYEYRCLGGGPSLPTSKKNAGYCELVTSALVYELYEVRGLPANACLMRQHQFVSAKNKHFGIRSVSDAPINRTQPNTQRVSPEVLSEQRLAACDSFGFERGTEAHAECAMKLYMNEQNQGTAKAVTSSNNQQTAALARQQAIQEATNREQKRIQELEASLRMMQFGIDLMNGTTSSPTPSKTHSQTYSINGQIIRCTTTGSITTCL